jgi:uncharacterized membrane protein YkvA (DUF1232 family)
MLMVTVLVWLKTVFGRCNALEKGVASGYGHMMLESYFITFGATHASPLQYNICMNAPDPRPPRQPIPYRTSVFVRIANYLKLFWRLLNDQKVSLFLKLIPLIAFLYVISPMDRIIPVVDDLVILFLGIYLFVELCPENIVNAHRQAIEGVLEGQARDAQDDEKIAEEDILEGEFHDDP